MPRSWDGFYLVFVFVGFSFSCGCRSAADNRHFSLLCSSHGHAGCFRWCVPACTQWMSLFSYHTPPSCTIPLARYVRIFRCASENKSSAHDFLSFFAFSQKKNTSGVSGFPSHWRLEPGWAAGRAPSASGALLGACFRSTDRLASSAMAIALTNAAADSFWVAPA